DRALCGAGAGRGRRASDRRGASAAAIGSAGLQAAAPVRSRGRSSAHADGQGAAPQAARATAGRAQDMIRRRHVIYVEGYDPQGAQGYHNLFERSFRRFLKNWPLKTTIGALQIDSEDLAHWTVDAAGPNWAVTTRYDFLR